MLLVGIVAMYFAWWAVILWFAHAHPVTAW